MKTEKWYEKRYKEMFSLYRPLKLGSVVRLKTVWRRGETGTVEVRYGPDLPNLENTGLERYGIRMKSSDLLADLRRYQLKEEGGKI